jgi:predicted negative regulator of RcsB-dependent stress response
MSERSAFEKIHVDERDKADLGGVLEQLNLPPSVVAFVRKYQKIIFILLGLISVVVIVWALYGSYAEKRIAESSSALAVAEKLAGEKKIAALTDVVEDFSGTDSALWAKIELARYATKQEELENALQHYTEVHEEIKKTNPLYPLVTFGIAQTHESLGNYESALQDYTTLKNISGYENIGYNGTARIYEVQGNKESAINEYEQYLGILSGDVTGSGTGEKEYIMEKILRLKASL